MYLLSVTEMMEDEEFGSEDLRLWWLLIILPPLPPC